MARRQKTHRRERTLGQAIGLGLATTFGVALALFLILVLIPGTALHNFFLLAHNNASATLRSGALFQQYAESIDVQEALFVSPLSLFCGGLVLGRLAPSYTPRKRLLLSGVALAFGTVAAALAFVWPEAITQQAALNSQEGGYIYPVTAPPDLIARQILWALVWIAIGTLGTWAGVRLRDRGSKQDRNTAASLRPVRR